MKYMIPALLLALSVAAEGQNALKIAPHAQATLHSFTDSAQVYPESVTIDHATGEFYVGSVKEGTIYKGRIGQPGITVFSPAGADGRTMATGMSYANGRLVVVGRQTGQIFVYDTKSAKLVPKLANGLSGTSQTFLNDVTFAKDGSAYVTDSVNPVLYRVAPSSSGYELQEFLRYEGTPVKWVRAEGPPGINVNGIVATPDGRHLIIAKRNENALYRVQLSSRQITPVTMPPGTIDTPDGLYIYGNTLYVAQNDPRAVAVLKLSPDYSSAQLQKNIFHPSFAFPTSVAHHNGKLLVVSAQFDTAGSPAAVQGTRPPVVPFWVSEVPVE